MSKAKLIERLEWYYPMERFHTYVTFPLIAILLLLFYSATDILFVLYGLAVCIYILYQGQHYWKLKLYRLTEREFDQQKNLAFFKRSKRINIILIAAMPLIFLLQWYIAEWSFTSDILLIGGWVANIFAVVEHLNYYVIQISIDNEADVDYLKQNKRLKKAHLARDLEAGKI